MKRLLLVLCLLGCGTQDTLIEKQKEELQDIPLLPIPDTSVPEARPTPIGASASEVPDVSDEPPATIDTGEVSASDVTLLVFTAKWCRYCPAVKTAAKEACDSTEAKYVEVDFDRYPDYAKRWGVDSLPTLITVHGDVERWRREGQVDASQIVTAVLSSRQTMNWGLKDLKAEIARYARTRNVADRWQVRGMAAYEHLTRDHLWPKNLVEGLTLEEQLWLHDATHRGSILP